MGLLATTKALVVLALGLTAHAAREFGNTGTLSGWSRQSLDSGTQGTIEQKDNVFLRGPTSIKTTQTFIPGYQGRYHAEVVRDQGYSRGQTKYYGFAFRLSQDWEFVGQQSYNLAQFIADFTNTGCDDWMPSTMIFIRNNQLSTRVKFGSVCSQQNTYFNNIATVQKGVWHKLVLQVGWKSDTSGIFKVWFDGNVVLDRTGLATTVNDDRQFSFRVGIYANGWHDENHSMVGSQAFRQIWYDDIAIGSTLADVNPGVWTRKRSARIDAREEDAAVVEEGFQENTQAGWAI